MHGNNESQVISKFIFFKEESKEETYTWTHPFLYKHHSHSTEKGRKFCRFSEIVQNFVAHWQTHRCDNETSDNNI